jgi:predicted NBD/HSP70 family sugar kinase
MGRSLPTASQLILSQLAELKPLYAALRRSDQLALDEIFGLVQQHRAALANAANLLPLEVLLVLVLLEEHKRATRICEKLYSELESLKRSLEISDGEKP